MIPFRCCFAGSLPFSLSTVKQTTLFHSISEMFFTFLARKTHWVKLFSLNVCEAALQAAIKGGNFGAKLTHLCGFWLDLSFFSRVKTIVRSSDWLQLICVRNLRHSFLVSISQYVYNKVIHSTITQRVRVGYEMVDSQRVGYNHLISNKREWNNCFIKNAHKISRILPDFICN